MHSHASPAHRSRRLARAARAATSRPAVPADRRRTARELRRDDAARRPYRRGARAAGRRARAIESSRRSRSRRKPSRCTWRACAVGAVFVPLNTAYTSAEIAVLPRRCRSEGRSRCRKRRDLAGAAHGRRLRVIEPRRRDSRLPDLGPVRPRRAVVHVRHDRALQGRDADAREPRDQCDHARAGVALHGAATCCCTPCRSFTCTACSSRSTPCSHPAARCCSCPGSTPTRSCGCCRKRR